MKKRIKELIKDKPVDKTVSIAGWVCPLLSHLALKLSSPNREMWSLWQAYLKNHGPL